MEFSVCVTLECVVAGATLQPYQNQITVSLLLAPLTPHSSLITIAFEAPLNETADESPCCCY